MNFIVAVANDYAIGKNNDLLFHLPSDLKYYKEKTSGKVIVMGERTYFSLPKRPLPNRTSIVLSDNPNFHEEGIVIVRNIGQLFTELKKYNDDDIFVSGGASIYNLLMDYCKYAYITKINKIVPADTYIKNIETTGNWKEISSSGILKENDLEFAFKVFENKNIKAFD